MVERAKLTPGHLQFSYGFGSAVSVEENRIVIGTENFEGTPVPVSIFKRDGDGNWVVDHQFLPDNAADGYYGATVLLANQSLFVGDRTGQIVHIHEPQLVYGEANSTPICTSQGRCICERGWGGADCSIQLPDNPAPPAPAAGGGGGCSIQPYIVNGEAVAATLVAECPGQDPILLRAPRCGDGVVDAGEEVMTVTRSRTTVAPTAVHSLGVVTES